jgi:hypothetical protein
VTGNSATATPLSIERVYDQPVGDRPRFLHRRSELAYTDESRDALQGEPEAVSSEYQRELSRQAPRRAAARDLEAWQPCRDVIAAELVKVREHRFARDLSSELRVIERQLERIDRLIV